MCFYLKNRSYNLLRPLPHTTVFGNGYVLPVSDYVLKLLISKCGTDLI